MPEWLETTIRSFSFLILLLILTRALGRKMAARMTHFEIAYTIVLGIITGAISIQLVDLVNGTFALLTWGLIGIALSFLSLKSKMVRDAIHGREAVVIKNGKVMEEQLRRVRYTPEDLLQQLRNKQIFSLADVEFAVMESNGEINALLKSDRQPITPKLLGVQTAPVAGIQTVILDGTIMDEPLTTMGLSRGWLREELEKIGVSPENVFIAQVDSMGELYIDLFDDALQIPKPSTRQLLLNSLEQAKADLESYALDTDDPKSKQMYQRCSEELSSIIYDVRHLLK
jgi:uncharacterized membrane protein YcaP (DUF421 family)